MQSGIEEKVRYTTIHFPEAIKQEELEKYMMGYIAERFNVAFEYKDIQEKEINLINQGEARRLTKNSHLEGDIYKINMEHERAGFNIGFKKQLGPASTQFASAITLKTNENNSELKELVEKGVREYFSEIKK